MAYSLTISQKGGLFKTTSDFAMLEKQFGSAVRFGGIGPYFNFLEKPGAPGEGMEAEYMVYGKKSPLGRGFFLYIGKGYTTFEVTSPLPTTVHDLEDMFAFAGQLAKYLGAKVISDEAGSFPLSHLPALYPEVVKNNGELLKSQAITRPGFAVSGVKFPVQLSTMLCGRIGALPAAHGEKFLSAYLNEKQVIDIPYLYPAFYRDEANQPCGRYDLRESTGYIIPKKPFIPYGPPPFPGEDICAWQVSMAADQLGSLGNLPYGVFVEKLADSEKREFDDKHYLMQPLSLRRMQELLGVA